MSAAATPVYRPRSQAKLVFFLVFGALTVFVTYMKNRAILDPTSEIGRHFAPAMLFVAVHGFFAGLAMLLGAFQFSNRLRARYLKVHRALGYVYVVSVFIGAPIALPIVRNARRDCGRAWRRSWLDPSMPCRCHGDTP